MAFDEISGHSFSWGFGHPELLTQCFDNGRLIPGHFGPMNPARNTTYTFLTAFFKEILGVFKDQYVHLGNDEVPTGCWYVICKEKSFKFNILNLSGRCAK